jgi:hypothetical protein
MPHSLDPFRKKHALSFDKLFKPSKDAMIGMSPLESQCNRPLKMSFEDHLRALVFFHLEEHKSAQHLLQVLEEDDFARNDIAPKEGIKKSSFSEATRATKVLPNRHPDLGNLVGIDGSLIDATLSMYWADYRKGAKKAKVHVGFDLNRSIPPQKDLFDRWQRSRTSLCQPDPLSGRNRRHGSRIPMPQKV